MKLIYNQNPAVEDLVCYISLESDFALSPLQKAGLSDQGVYVLDSPVFMLVVTLKNKGECILTIIVKTVIFFLKRHASAC